MPERYDLLIVGGGINGAGIARDAAGRGLTVLLVEQDDLAGHTSSASTKLVHGGLRYLEHYEFRLVREALGEREILLRAAPHIIRPMRFVLPQGDAARPAWLVRAGLLLYDYLGKRRKLPGSRAIDLTRHPTGAALKSGLHKAFVYSDCWAEDARLVVLNAMDAAARGARILTRTRCINVVRQQEYWQAELESVPSGAQRSVRAHMLVNATGPWVRDFLDNVARTPHQHNVRMVAGSHIVVSALFEHDHAYLFQNTDRRIVFAIPFEGRYTLIGTTDRDYVDEPQAVRVTDAEIDYLCTAVNRYFAKSISRQDVVWQYAGVRPLYDDGTDNATQTTREYLLDYDTVSGAPLLTVFGGKITTYRRLAEHAMEHIQRDLNRHKGAWTATAPLPGGDMPNADFEAFLADFKRSRPWLPGRLALHYARTYGTCAMTLCGAARQMGGLGENLGGGLYEAELDYLVNVEWAQSAEDVLWRRTKWGLHLDAAQRARVACALGPAPAVTVSRAQGL